ncbi:hypothetical protein L210DRAFT_3649396 [Boletus edulis BED1]|uniref:Uncharacterized protein n=1 Tax=Boletus edulis BED1 TaxID=1328754 RepID=A0AAD4BLN6_BOLED|nr:hypothetical protein L210DRAFT_3649396 [Boletus edulis BED1]
MCRSASVSTPGGSEQLAYPDPNAKEVKKKKKEKVYHPQSPGKGKNGKYAPAPADGVAADETRASGPPASQPDDEAI